MVRAPHRRPHLQTLNADAAHQAAAHEGLRRYWSTRKRPPMTAQQLWKYRLLYPVVGRDEALRQLGLPAEASA